jgi:hypothetical protein
MDGRQRRSELGESSGEAGVAIGEEASDGSEVAVDGAIGAAVVPFGGGNWGMRVDVGNGGFDV